MDERMLNIASRFAIEGEIEIIKPLGEGFINDTFVVKTVGNAPNYILQRKNHAIFPDVPGMMDNIVKVTTHLKEKIAAGKIAAFFKDICLLQQDFVRSDLFQGDVAGYIADASKKLGGKATFVNAIHYIKGEGIEKKEENFAAEVAAQIAGAGK